MDISYLYEPGSAYAKAISDAKTFDELHNALTPYSLIAGDALDVLASIDFSFTEFRAGLLKERKGEFAGESWILKYGAIAIPALMMHVQMVADQYKVPWGLAYIRLREAKRIVERDGRAIWQVV